MFKKLIGWNEHGDLPESPGVYAWYFRPELTNYDIENLIKDLAKIPDDNVLGERAALVRDFLYKRIFRYFEQKPYYVELTGQLKPKYRGELNHQPSDDLSKALVDRIAASPHRLIKLSQYLQESTPLIASPLYIGKAENLKLRVSVHKKMIGLLKNQEVKNQLLFLQYEFSNEEIDFANRVVDRAIPSSRLYVAYQETAGGGIEVDLENLLNRIYFPILGRN
jgi:hypothetical protein